MQYFRNISLIVCIAISGCSATGPAFKQVLKTENSKAILYIYRPATFALSARTSSFEIDGQKIIDLKNNGYTTISLSSGQHKIKQSWNYWLFDTAQLQKPLEINVFLKEGQPHFVRLASGVGSAGYQTMKISWELAEVEPSLGLQQIGATVLQENTYQFQ